MWFYVCILLVVPQGIYMVDYDSNDDSTEDTSLEDVTKFGEVVQNISKVNDVLEKLITNYEHLKRLYKSNETDDSSSDDNADDVSEGQRNTDNSKHKENSEVQTTSTDTMTSENNDKDGELDGEHFRNGNGKNYNEKDETYFNVRTGQNKIRKIPNKLLSMSKSQPQIDHSYTRDASRHNSGYLNKKENEKNKHDNNEVLVPNSKAKKTEIVFMNSQKQQKDVELQPKNIIRSKAKTISKTYSIYTNHHTTTTEDDNAVKTTKKQRENSKRGAHVQFHKDYGASSNKPSISNRNKALKSKQGVNVNNDVEKKKNTSEASYIDEKTDEDISEAGMEEDEVLIHNEQFKTDVLRTAYDQSCLKLVVRKCHKACKGALRSICKHFKCRRPLKNRFLSYEKRGCIKEFGAVEPNVTKSNKISMAPIDDIERRNQMPNDPYDAYLSAACFNTASKGKRQVPKPRSNITISQTGIDKQVNILRDKLEEACSKISARKCKVACNTAHNMTCLAVACVSGMKSRFKRHCNRECDKTFNINDSDSDTSSDSSD